MNPSLTSIKRLITLLNDGHYHSGNSIGAVMQLTRSMVWKLIHQLRAAGIDIKATKGKGYRLVHPITLLVSRQIKKYITNPQYQSQIDIAIFDSLTSTNSYLRNLELSSQKISICLAEQQTSGKGRLQRNWYSPFASNLYFSGKWSFMANISKLAGLSLSVALAIVRMLGIIGIKENIVIKWPNDILWHNKKLAGILIEATTDTQSQTHAIIGIGINVNMIRDVDAQISQPWTSIQNIIGRPMDRNFLAGTLINQLLEVIDLFSLHGLPFFQREWQQYDYLSGKTIQLMHHHALIIGEAMGINEIGEIMIKQGNGEISSYCAGEVSVSKAAV